MMRVCLIVILIVTFTSSNVLGEESSTFCSNLTNGTYRTVSTINNRNLIAFDQDKFYSYHESSNSQVLQLDQSGQISDLIGEQLNSTIEYAFRVQNLIYLAINGSNRVLICDGSTTKKINETTFDVLNQQFAHLIVRQRPSNQVLGYLILSNAGGSQNSKSVISNNDLVIETTGSASVSTSTSNGQTTIKYNGYLVPTRFNAYAMDDSSNLITFFDREQTAKLGRTSNPPISWRPAASYFGCSSSRKY